MINFVNALLSIDKKQNLERPFSLHYSYLVDPSNELTYDDIRQEPHQFTSTNVKKIPYKLSTQSYWIKIEIANKLARNQDLVLFADNSLLNIMDVYFPYDSNKQKVDLLSSKIDSDNAYPHLKFILNSRQTIELTIQLQTEGPPNIPLMVLPESDYEQRTLYTQLIFGAFIGIALVMILYNLVLYFAVRDLVYLFYIGYLASAFLVLSSLTGFGYYIFSNDSQVFISQNIIGLDYLLVIFLMLFTLKFLRLERNSSHLYKIGITLTLILAIVGIYSQTIDTISQTKLFFSIQPAIYIFAVAALVYRVRTDFSWTKFYIFSWVPLLIGSAIQPLVLLNYLEYSFIASNAFLVAILAETTLMSFALAERLKRNEKDRLNDVAYHPTSGLPRKSNIDNTINLLAYETSNKFSVVVIKPEHIEKIALYIDDSMNTELFKRLYSKLSSLFQFNDAIYYLTDKKEKICFINNNSLCILVNNKRNSQPLATLVQSIQQVVADSFKIKDINLPLSAVIGIANYPEHGLKSHQLLNHAILAMAQGELTHKKWAFFENESSNKANYLLTLAGELKSAIEHNKLAIYHQPQIDLSTLRVCSSECLLRWNHDKEGFIPPNIFIPVAEDMGLINQLTLWVMKQALNQQRILSQEHNFNHMVSINISGKDISSEHFFNQALDIIEASEVPTDKIILELTESAQFTYNDDSLTLIEKLTELGITISIDDFGTGYSTMSQVSHLPFQELKVDRQFVENVNSDKKRLVIAENTVRMAKGIGLEVVAEGINSQADEDTLRKFGCDIGQGYFYAKPMPLGEYIEWLENLDNGRIKQPLKGEYIPAGK